MGRARKNWLEYVHRSGEQGVDVGVARGVAEGGRIVADTRGAGVLDGESVEGNEGSVGQNPVPGGACRQSVIATGTRDVVSSGEGLW